MYSIPVATGSAGAAALGATQVPAGSVAHAALAFTGFAAGTYVIIALSLILVGLVLRKLSAVKPQQR